MSNDFLKFVSLYKNFPGVTALSDVSFSVSEASVKALVGENGAGKSTLLKILSGAQKPTAGNIVIGGRECVFYDTLAAIRAGVAVIYQELQLVPQLSIAENIYLGHLTREKIFLSYKELNAEAKKQLAMVGLSDIDPRIKISRLSIGQRQMVEIAKALTRGAKIIAFDEPTSSLSTTETECLFKIIENLKKQKKIILYVSHRLEEIFAICDSVTVLRDGKHICSYDSIKDLTRDKLVKDMVGRELKDIYNYQARDIGSTLLTASKVMGEGVKKPMSFTVKKSEIVGCFGLVGSGRSELLNILFGVSKKKSGVVKILENKVLIANPSEAIAQGIMLCPEDRKKEGIIPMLSVQENINISARRLHLYFKTIINTIWEKENAKSKISRLAIKTPSPKQLISNLSGGNQQKAILARWLSENIKILMLDEPTRGIDIGAKAEIYELIYQLAKKEMGILMVSSDLPEILGVCDRVLIFREGELVGNISKNEATAEKILSMALPITKNIKN